MQKYCHIMEISRWAKNTISNNNLAELLPKINFVGRVNCTKLSNHIKVCALSPNARFPHFNFCFTAVAVISVTIII